MKTNNPLAQILINSIAIYLAQILGGALFTYPFGNTYNPDHPRLILFSAILACCIQAYNDKKQTKQSNSKSAYHQKYSKLLNMMGGDREAANRLIARYGIDKAISDLERDRDIR